jgi:hypothetical protein
MMKMLLLRLLVPPQVAPAPVDPRGDHGVHGVHGKPAVRWVADGAHGILIENREC